MRLQVVWPNGNYDTYSNVLRWETRDGAVLIYGNEGLDVVIGPGQYRSVTRLLD